MVKTVEQLRNRVPKGAAKMEEKKDIMADNWYSKKDLMKANYQKFLKNLAVAFGKNYNKNVYDSFASSVDLTKKEEVSSGISAGVPKWQDNYIDAMTK